MVGRPLHAQVASDTALHWTQSSSSTQLHPPAACVWQEKAPLTISEGSSVLTWCNPGWQISTTQLLAHPPPAAGWGKRMGRLKVRKFIG